MKKSIKGVLLSALVFPGAGQLYLKRYRMASLLIITAFICLYLMVVEAVDQAVRVLEEIETSGAAINANSIVEMSSRAANNADTTTTSVAATLIMLCWIAGIVDAYLSGKQADKQ